MENNNKSNNAGLIAIIVALIGLIGVMITLFGGERAAVREIIKATATAEEIYRLTSVPQIEVPVVPVEETITNANTPESPKLEPTSIVATTSVPNPDTNSATAIIPTNTIPPPATHNGFKFSIEGFEENGIQVNFEQSGLFNISYDGEAYSPWPNDNHPDNRGWFTGFMIYVNRPIEWGTTEYGLDSPVNEDYYVGAGDYNLSKESTVQISQGARVQVRVDAGDYITIALIDERGQYGDNRGRIDISIEWIRP